jgi:hypothetical protein
MPLSRLDLALLGEDERIRAPRFRRQEDRVLLLRRGRRSTLLALRVNAAPREAGLYR